MKTIIVALKQAERLSVKKRNLPWKRHITTMQQGIFNTLKNLKVHSIELAKSSFEDFKKCLLEGEFYTMFTRKNIKMYNLFKGETSKNTVLEHVAGETTTETTIDVNESGNNSENEGNENTGLGARTGDIRSRFMDGLFGRNPRLEINSEEVINVGFDHARELLTRRIASHIATIRRTSKTISAVSLKGNDHENETLFDLTRSRGRNALFLPEKCN